MQLLRVLPASLIFVLLSTVVSAVPIQSDSVSAEDDSVVWVTETVWPCEGPSSTSSALAAESTYSAFRSASQKNADYETVPVDGSNNADAVAQESPSDVSSVGSSYIELAAVATSMADSITDTASSTMTSSEILVYTAVNEDTATTTSETTLAADDASSSTTTTDPATSSTISIDLPVTTTATGDYAANITYTTPRPTIPFILPTFAVSNNGTNTTCTTTDDGNDDYTEAEESSYWATATEVSIIYSDYTVMVTMKSTSVVTIFDTATAGPVATTTTSVTTTDPVLTVSATPVARYSNMTTASTPSNDDTLTYTLGSTEKQSVTSQSLDPSSAMTAATSTDSFTPIITTSIDSSTAPASDPSIETVSGTVITYVDVTTTIASGSSTTTITDTVSQTPSYSSDDGYETTTTTTQWVTRTIIVDETGTAVAARKLRRRILVTRS